MKKDLKLILIISIIIIMGIVCFVLFNKKIIIDPKPIVQETSIEEIYGSRKSLDTYIETLYLNVFGTCSNGEKFDFTKKNKLYFSDLKEEYINNIILTYLRYNDRKLLIDKIEDESYLRFKKDDLKLALKTLFGKKVYDNYSYSDNFAVKEGQITLDHDMYVGKIPNNDCTDGKYVSFYKYNGEVKDNKYYLEVALYYSESSNTIENNNDNIIKYAYISDTQTEPICKIEDIKNNLNKFTKYRLVFGVEDNNAIFDHIELIK